MFWGLKEVIKTNHVQPKIKNIMPMVYSQCGQKVVDSGHFSGWSRADILTNMTDKHASSSFVQFFYVVVL